MLKSILLFLTLNSMAIANDMFKLSFHDSIENKNKKEFYLDLESAQARQEVLGYNSEIFSKIEISHLKNLDGEGGAKRKALQVDRVKIGGEGGGE